MMDSMGGGVGAPPTTAVLTTLMPVTAVAAPVSVAPSVSTAVRPPPQQPGPKREIRRCSDPARSQNLWDAIKAVRMQKQIPAITRMSRYMNRFYQIKKGRAITNLFRLWFFETIPHFLLLFAVQTKRSASWTRPWKTTSSNWRRKSGLRAPNPGLRRMPTAFPPPTCCRESGTTGTASTVTRVGRWFSVTAATVSTTNPASSLP